MKYKPCPFCGGTDLTIRVGIIDGCMWGAQIKCENCDALMIDGKGLSTVKVEAMKATAKLWNTRAK